MLKTALPFFVFFCLCATSCTVVRNWQSKDKEKYVATVINLAQQGGIQTYDSLGKPISVARFNQIFYRYDSVLNDQITRPRFVDNIYHYWVGFALTHHIDFEDYEPVLTKKSFWSNDKIVYITGHYYVENQETRQGYQRLIRWFFVNETTLQKVQATAAKTQKNYASIRKLPDSLAAKLFITTKNSKTYWANKAIFCQANRDDKALSPHKIDSCQMLFQLFLYENGIFEQSYHGASECHTQEMLSRRETGYEDSDPSSVDLLHTEQFCEITRPKGFWVLENSNTQLIFLNAFGAEQYRFEVVIITENEMQLKQENYLVTMEKVKMKK